MTPERLQEIKARCEAATSGEWSYSIDVETEQPRTLFSDFEGNEIDIAVFETWDATGYDKEMLGNAQFIAHARQDLPDCLKEIGRLKGKAQAILDECHTNSDEQDTIYFVEEHRLYELIEGS